MCEEEEGKGVRYVNQRKKCVREKHGGEDAKGACLTPSLSLSLTHPHLTLTPSLTSVYKGEEGHASEGKECA